MRKIIISEHVSLDGFVGGPKGEMDWIKIDDAMFDLVGKFTDDADTALYGRVTWEMMEGYWPTAADKPDATKHDKEHSAWYNKVHKVVLSSTLDDKNLVNTTVINKNLDSEIKKIKEQGVNNILIFGSPGAAHSLMEYDLIDEYWLFVNPVILGRGIPFFEKIKDKINLRLIESVNFPSGVAGLHYEVVR